MALDPKEKKRRADARFEIRARELALRRLATPLKRAKAAGEKKKAARQLKVEALSEYKDADEAGEAFGYGLISEDEYSAILDHLEAGEAFVEEISPEEAAASILEECVARISREIAEFRFDLLPPEEKQRVRDHREEMINRIKRRNTDE